MTKEVIRMVKVSIRVRSGAASFDVAVQAESLQRALSLVKSRYSGGDVRVRYLTGPGGASTHEYGTRTNPLAA